MSADVRGASGGARGGSTPASPVMALPVSASGAASSANIASHSRKDIATVVKAMKANVRSGVTTREYIISLNARLFDHDDKAARGNFQKFVLNTTGGIAALISAMDTHAADSVFAETALVFLYNLIYHNGKRNPRIAAKVVKRGGSRTVLSIINKNANNIRVVHSASVVVVAIAPSDAKIAAAARLSGCLANLLAVLRGHASVPKEAAAGVLCCLCSLCKGELNVAHLGKKGAAAVVLDICTKNVQRANSLVLLWSVRALTHLAASDEVARELVREGAVSLMLNVLFEQSSSVEAQKQAIEVLRQVIRVPDGLQQFSSSGGFAHVVNLISENNADKSEAQQQELVLQLYRLHDITELPIGDDGDLYWDPPGPEDSADGAASEAAAAAASASAADEEALSSHASTPSEAAGLQAAPSPVEPSPPASPTIPLSSFSPELVEGFCVPLDTALQDAIVVHHVRRFTEPRPAPSCPSAIDFVAPLEELYLQTSAQRIAVVRAQLRRLTQPALLINKVVYDDIERDTAMPTTRVSVMQQQQQQQQHCEPELPALRFSSGFESGNLKRAIRVFEDEYDLILSTDINTSSFIQWFYFSIENARSDVTYKFNIINMEKPASMFNEGQRVLLFSEKRFMWSGFGWLRTGHDILYCRNSYRRRGGRRKKDAGASHFTLTFSIRFPHDDDRFFIANCYPYTYSDLISSLRKLRTDVPNLHEKLLVQNMCATQCGNATPLLTITALYGDGVPCAVDEIAQRSVCVISARVHPGESNASYMAKGLVEYLLADTDAAHYLRKNFVFKIVPMLNPDGVVNGNHRCALGGKDLNREFLRPDRHRAPTIFYLKSLCKFWKNTEGRNLVLYGDFHGHSRRKNFFIFGCSSRKLSHGIVVEKVFPRLLEDLTPYFSFGGSGFKVQRAKRMTGRVVFWRELGIRMSFTLEGSMMGGDNCDFMPLTFGEVEEDLARRNALARGTAGHFGTGHFGTMGAMFAKAIMLLHQGEQGLHSRPAQIISELLAEANGAKAAVGKALTGSMGSADETASPAELRSPVTTMSGSYASSRRGSLRKQQLVSSAAASGASRLSPTSGAPPPTYTAAPQDVADVFRTLLRAGPAGATAKIAMSEGGDGEESDADNDDGDGDDLSLPDDGDGDGDGDIGADNDADAEVSSSSSD